MDRHAVEVVRTSLPVTPSGPRSAGARARVIWLNPAEHLGFEWQAEAFGWSQRIVEALAQYGAPFDEATTGCMAYVHEHRAMADLWVVPRSGSQDDVDRAVGLLKRSVLGDQSEP